MPKSFQVLAMLVTASMLWSWSATAAERPAIAGANVPVKVRVQGLALGSTLSIRQGASTVEVTLNDEYVIGTPIEAGTPLDLQLMSQPPGQQCAISELAPSFVPADSAPIFVRCRFVPVPTFIMPQTLPNAPLSVLLGASAMRPAAYPGIVYESRPGVIGGIFPYEFRLQSVTFNGVQQSLAVIALDFRTGGLRFVPATEGNYNITLEIRDSGSPQKVLQHTFLIDVAANRFVFVAPTGVDDPAHGSRALPYRTVAYALPRTSSNQLITLRKGSYATGGFGVGDANAKQFIAYPDEVAVFDLGYAGSIDVRIDLPPAARFEGIDFTRVQQHGLLSDPSKSGLVVRHARFLDGREGPVALDNPAFIHGFGDGPPLTRHRLLIQDNDFGPFVMSSAGAYATTLFDAGDSLIENNQLRLGATTGGLHDKDNSQRNTYRQNYIEFSSANANNEGIQVSAQSNSEMVHIHHNLLVNSGVRLGLQCFQETCFMRDHDVHHNTMVEGGMLFGWGVFNPTSQGTRISHNLMRSTTAPYAWHSCMSTLPSAFSTQLSARSNRLETASALAMRDTECGGSAPMNMSWSTWRGTHAMDTVAAGSVLSVGSDLVGMGPTLGLPAGDARRAMLGHLYPLPVVIPDQQFADGFE